jgi:hypothetical protein
MRIVTEFLRTTMLFGEHIEVRLEKSSGMILSCFCLRH